MTLPTKGFDLTPFKSVFSTTGDFPPRFDLQSNIELDKLVGDDVPEAVKMQGSQAIRDFLWQVAESKGSMLWTKMRVALMGTAMSGKTSLVKSFISAAPQVTQEEDRTANQIHLCT
eukprot:GILI01089953.1.p1 GENE.GILI01089953.1~~GILI01089953.1.p1  ORF type:complete len:130 (+),score=15.96 GILI01089953.1:43-390(+)